MRGTIKVSKTKERTHIFRSCEVYIDFQQTQDIYRTSPKGKVIFQIAKRILNMTKTEMKGAAFLRSDHGVPVRNSLRANRQRDGEKEGELQFAQINSRRDRNVVGHNGSEFSL